MADNPNPSSQAAAAAPAAVAGNTPAQAPPPAAQPQPSPQPGAAPPAQPRQLTDSDVIQIPGPDGQMMTGTVRQLREAASRSMTPEQLAEYNEFVAQREQFNLFRGIQNGDKDAILKMFDAGDAPAAPLTAEQQIAQLQQQVESLQSTIRQVTPVTEMVSNMSEQATMRSMIGGNPDKVPFLADAMAKNPVILNKVMSNFGLMSDMLKQNSIDIRSLPAEKLQEIRARVLLATEQDLATQAAIWGVAKPNPGGQQQTPQGGPQVVDDQINRNQGQGTRHLRWVNGKLVNDRGQVMVQTGDGQLVPAAIDSHIPGTNTAGGVSVGTQPPGQRTRMTRQEMQAHLRSQVAASSGAQQ